MITLIEIIENELYFDEELDAIQVMREQKTLTPNGNPVNGRWVLRRNGEFVDFDKYRFDLMERNGLKVKVSA